MSVGRPAMSDLLQVIALTRCFGALRAVDQVSFGLRSGGMTAMIGPNGAGKSTCFDLITGRLAADAGCVLFRGEPVDRLSARRRARLGLGRTFQIAGTFASMTVRENVQVALLARHRRFWRPWGAARQQHRTEADALLERLGIAPLAARSCGVLSYGDVKRVELAMALAGAPSLLLMDEPTAGMAPTERRALMRLVRDCADDEGLSVLFTEHDMDVVFGHADRILVLDRGRLIADGGPESVRADKEVRRVYLGTNPADLGTRVA